MLLQSALCRSPRVLLRCTAVNVVFLVAIFMVGAANVFLHLTDVSYI